MKQFRNIDIFIFAVLATVANYLSIRYGNSLNSNYFYTLKYVVLFVVLLRWGKYGGISILISNALLYFTTDMNFINFVIYEVFAGMFFALPIFIYWNRDRNLIIKGKLKYLGFLVASHLSLCVGKGIAIFIIEGATTGAIDFLASTLFIITIDILVAFLLRAVNGLVVDMEKYDLVNDEV